MIFQMNKLFYGNLYAIKCFAYFRPKMSNFRMWYPIGLFRAIKLILEARALIGSWNRLLPIGWSLHFSRHKMQLKLQLSVHCTGGVYECNILCSEFRFNLQKVFIFYSMHQNIKMMLHSYEFKTLNFKTWTELY